MFSPPSSDLRYDWSDWLHAARFVFGCWSSILDTEDSKSMILPIYRVNKKNFLGMYGKSLEAVFGYLVGSFKKALSSYMFLYN